MSDFQFITRGQQSPQGKQRVYFTCHPDDFEKFFEEIRKEILDRQDCAIFYLEPGTQPEDVEDYKLRLREMQLFVVPVTTKLLIKANRAMDVEVPFAFENHIPVLPLMQESGLDDVFNKKFGDLQYLDKHKVDPTAIPYEEKLTKYLESVIVGDELAKKVRAAFDAYIFLSYRKKDRKYAQELMKLVHSNSVCRDIAIWYDEFLTPGENFNEAIRAALEKSEVFALAVTPNLINEINYILTTEYPMARNMGKKILPAEMESTDREKLHNMYDDIPELIEKGDTTALAERLSSLFESFAIRENDSDSQHNFFIGLAYLGGIDVEVNHERAVALITGAAEQDYIPAIEKLVSMYNNGEGVKRDYYKSVEWQKKLVELRKIFYEDAPDKHAASILLAELQNLGDKYEELWQLSLAFEVYNEMQIYSEQFLAKYLDDCFMRYQSKSYYNLGNISAAQSRLNNAEVWYCKSLAIVKMLADKIGNEENSRDLSLIYNNLGEIARLQGKLDNAEVWSRRSLHIYENLAHNNGTPQSWIELVNSYHNLGRIVEEQGKVKEALELYRKGYEIAMKTINCSMTTQSFRALRDIEIALGCFLLNYYAPSRVAEECFRKSLTICKILAENTGTIQSLSDLSLCYSLLSQSLFVLNRYDEAEALSRDGLVISEDLLEKTGTVHALRNLTNCYIFRGNVLEAQGNISEAEDVYNKSLINAKKLVDESRISQDLIILSSCYERLCRIAASQSDYIKAKELCLEGIQVATKVADKTGFSTYTLIFRMCAELGAIEETRCNFDEAEEWYKKGITTGEFVAKGMVGGAVYKSLSIIYNSLGRIMEIKNRINEAEEWYRKELDVNISNYKTDDVDSKRSLSNSYDNLGDIAKVQGKIKEAKEWYRKELNIISAIVSETKDLEDRRSLAYCYSSLGDVAKEQDNIKDAEEWYCKELNIISAIVSETKDLEDRRSLAYCYSSLGDVAKAQDNIKDAEDWYHKELNVISAIVFETEDLEDRRSLAYCYSSLGNIAKVKNKIKEAEDWYRKELNIISAIVSQTEDLEDRHSLDYCYSSLGNIAKAFGKLNEAEKWYRKSLAICESIADEVNTVESNRDLSFSYNKLGDIAQARGKLSEAEEWYRKSLVIDEFLAKETNTVQSRHDLSISYNRLGDIAKALGKLSEAEEWYRKGLAIDESLAEETNTVESYDDLAISYYNIGWLLRDRSYLDKALQIWTQLAAQFPDNPSFQQRADIVKDAIQQLFSDN